MASVPARRKSAEERREDILAVAVRHFAESGYHGTSTENIAREAGISQPYLFRLFRTKRELFLACDDRACEKVLDAFRRAVARAEPGAELAAMGDAYIDELLPDRHAVLMLMQGFAATSDPAIQEHVRESYGELITEIGELSGATPDDLWSFVASGMLLNIVASLDLQAIAPRNPIVAAWAERNA